MYCPQCQQPIKADAKFCIACGSRIEASQQQAAAVEMNIQPIPLHPHYQGSPNPNSQGGQQAQQGYSGGSLQDNPYVKQGKEISKMYFGFAFQVFKSPYKMCQSVTEKDLINAIISLFLIALLMPLYSYIGVKQAANEIANIPFFDMVLKPFFIQLIFLLAVTGAIFLVAKMMKVNVTFKDVLAKFGTIMTVAVVFFILANIFILLSIYIFSVILVAIGFVMMTLTIIATILSLKTGNEIGGIDAYYAVFISYIIIGILFLILGENMIAGITSNITSEIGNMFW